MAAAKASIRSIGEFEAEPELKRQLQYFQRSAQQGVDESVSRSSERMATSPRVTSEYQAHLAELVLCDPSVAGFVVLLPHALPSDEGRRVRVKNVTSSTNVIEVRPPGGVTVEGFGSTSIGTAFGSVSLVWDGTAWWGV